MKNSKVDSPSVDSTEGKRPNRRLLFLAGLLVLIAVIFWWLDLGHWLTFERLKEQRQFLLEREQERPLFFALTFALIYIVSTAFSIPGATVLTLAGGAIFGFGWGMLIVSFSSTIGATLAFLASRFFLRDFTESRFRETFIRMNKGIQAEGAFYLFTLRLVPLFPFFLVNLVMGLTSLRVLPFFVVSQVGMLPGTAVYVNAGTQLAQLESTRGLLSPTLIVSFALIGLLPLATKLLFRFRSKPGTKK